MLKRTVFRRQFCCPAILLTVFTGWLTGCADDDSVRQYRAPKEIPLAAPPRREDAWFFKLTGPSNDVLKQLQPFSGLLRSLQFDDSGRPVYSTPQGWSRSPGAGMRFETLTIAQTDPELEVSVMSLSLSGKQFGEYLLENFNRWREQLGLSPYSKEDGLNRALAAGELMAGPSAVGMVVMVNLTGTTKEYGETRTLAAMVVPGMEGPQPAASSAPASQPPLTYQIPKGWKPSSGSAMRLVSLRTAGDADVSVTRLGGGGGVLENVNRWRGEVKLEPIDDAALADSAQEVPVGDRQGTWVEALGTEESTLAVIVEDGSAKWFFKMRGPKDVIENEREQFQEFLKSVRFANAAQADQPPPSK